MSVNVDHVIEKVFDSCKKLTPALIALSIALGLLLFLPIPILNKMGLAEIPKAIKSIIGIIFIISTTLIFTIIVWGVCGNWYKKYRNKKFKKMLRENFVQLPSDMKITLIEMLRNPDKKSKLDCTNGDTIYLQSKGFIYRPEQIIAPAYYEMTKFYYVATPHFIELYYEEPELFRI